MRWLKRIGIAVLVVVVVGVRFIYIASHRMLSRKVTGHPETLAASNLPLAEAARRARTFGCLDCHGEGLRGKKFVEIPQVVTMYAPNITRVAARATDEQLARAIRQGIGVDGRSLFIMPSISYRNLTDQETGDLVRYIRSLPVSGADHPLPSVGPLGRIGVIQGKFEAQPDVIAASADRRIPDLGPATAAGRHLVETHCSDCHGVTLEGGEAEPGLMAPDLSIAGAYNDPAFLRLLRAGVPADGRQMKLMDKVSKSAFSHLTNAEIAAIHAYLKARANVVAD
ncbi:cytochrome c [Sphingomonas rhizophila]|uniref:Cytochrome c n=1 Tax=Sphingomonas rhizophila TaxID=2071607 RepID=A0A7G9SC78_9SPHN|nr:cytochrome c [Sphingomonas rhizophila]QNN65453.1 cytochrome c [Sphingomonas rhizophila]